jgi:outer membrane scaffolding protein for murein synthesis (MipA/OmpV family)
VFRSEDAALGARVSTTWANKRFTRSYFGVTNDQSIASGLAVYTPGGGLKDLSFTVGGEYRLTPAWAIVANAGYTRLLGDIKSSPLVSRRGSANQFSAGAFAVYTF